MDTVKATRESVFVGSQLNHTIAVYFPENATKILEVLGLNVNVVLCIIVIRDSFLACIVVHVDHLLNDLCRLVKRQAMVGIHEIFLCDKFESLMGPVTKMKDARTVHNVQIIAQLFVQHIRSRRDLYKYFEVLTALLSYVLQDLFFLVCFASAKINLGKSDHVIDFFSLEKLSHLAMCCNRIKVLKKSWLK